MRWHALLLGLLVLTSGCLGIGSDETEETDEDIDAQDTNETETEDEVDAVNTTEWSSETYEGSISGTSFFAPAPPSEGQSFSFSTESGIETLFINLTTEGGDLSVYVAYPGCEVNGGCEETFETSDGEGQYVNESAEAGEWNVRFFPVDPVANDVSYTAEVAQGILVEG